MEEIFMNLKFSATSLDECLQRASSELNISKEALKYRVTKEEKKFFKKKVEIEILVDENKENDIKPDEKVIIDKIEEKKGLFGAKIENGRIMITESQNDDEIITIKSCPGVILFINGQQSDLITPVSEQDKIEYKIEENEPKMSVDIVITDDKMEAYININSVPEHVYELIDQGYHKNLTIAKKKVGDRYPPKCTLKELKEVLKSKGIKYGIMEDELNKICDEYQVNNKLIAKGLEAQDDISDEIKTFI